VVCWNGQTPVDNSWSPVFQPLLDAVNAQSWGSIDLFPTFGMDVFQVVKQPPITLPRRPPRATPAPMIPGERAGKAGVSREAVKNDQGEYPTTQCTGGIVLDS
jgi:hypothetical protein